MILAGYLSTGNDFLFKRLLVKTMNNLPEIDSKRAISLVVQGGSSAKITQEADFVI